MKQDIAQEGFYILHIHRHAISGHFIASGDFAVIYRFLLDIKVLPLAETLCVKFSWFDLEDHHHSSLLPTSATLLAQLVNSTMTSQL